LEASSKHSSPLRDRSWRPPAAEYLSLDSVSKRPGQEAGERRRRAVDYLFLDVNSEHPGQVVEGKRRGRVNKLKASWQERQNKEERKNPAP
jgi:hypothetical protein